MIAILLIIATSGEKSAPAPSGPQPSSVLPPLVSTFSDASTGITARMPPGWTAHRSGQVVRLESGDRTAIIGLAAFPGSSRAPTLLAAAYLSERKAYPGIKLKRAPGTTLAGLKARSLILSGHNRHRVPISILLAAAKGRTHSYVMDVFSTKATSPADLVQAQEIITALRLTG